MDRGKNFVITDLNIDLKDKDIVTFLKENGYSVKVLNLHGTKGTWQSDRLSIEKSGEELAENIVNIMKGKEHYRDIGSSAVKEAEAEKNVSRKRKLR